MAEKKQKYRKYSLQNDNYALPESDNQQPGERKIITGRVNIDYSVFRKTPEEKLKLKIAKLSVKK